MRLPGLEIDRASFRKEVHAMYRAIYASNCFGHNPPTHTSIMEKAIRAVIYQYSAGEDAIWATVEKIEANGVKNEDGN